MFMRGNPSTKRGWTSALLAATLLSILSVLFVPTGSAPADASTHPGPLAPGDSIYMVLTDRFFDGDSTNNDQGDGNYDPTNLRMYHGGDWEGLEAKLDYIAGMGFTAIWLSPVSENEPLDRVGTEASYHGYFTHDYAQPNPHFGTTVDLQNLIDAAHARGIKLILDAVPNHTADYLDGTSTTYNPADYTPASPLDDPNYFHHNGDCVFDGSMTEEEEQTCDLGGLDDLDQSNTFVSSHLLNTYKSWIDMGFSGVRVDAAAHLPKEWLATFEDHLGVPTFGEIFNGNTDKVSSFTYYQSGALDFPYFFTARSAFAADGDMRTLGTLFDDDYKYNDINRMVTFIDNHDRARFLTWADDNYQRLRSALSFTMTARGIPVIYYGTEQADDGNGNPNESPIANEDNRKSMTSFDETATIYTHIDRLNELRANYSAIQVGVQREMWEDEQVYAFSRRNDDTGDEVITIANGRFDPQTRTIPLRAESTIPIGATLTNLMNTSETVTVQAGGVTGKEITVALGEHQTMILAAGTPVSSYSPPPRNLTLIRVHYDVGWGNSIAIRGDTYPLSWDYGRGARNVAPDIWEWEMERIPAGQTFEFKPLINDEVWSEGSNFVGTGGDTIDIYPTFP